jgi:hypothetical protein
MKYIFLLALFACNKQEMKFKVGECFSGGDWKDYKTPADSNFGNTIYWKVNEIKNNAYIFTIHQINSNQELGSISQRKELVENVLEKIDCPN